VLLLSTFALFFVACEKQLEEGGGGAVSISITDQIATNSSFSILNVALAKADMQEMLDTPGTFTFFAPNNSVMIASGFNLEKIQQLFIFGTYLPHRGEHAAGNQTQSRSQSRNHVWAFISCYFFGYHYEHHDQPYLPWWKLAEAKDQTENFTN
jgi:hypothetical protein